MEGVLSSPIRVWFQLNPSYNLHNKHITTTYTFRRSIIHHKLPLPCSIRSQQSEWKDGSEKVSTTSDSGGDALNIKEWEVGRLEDEVAAQGIRIRRRPPTGPSQHYVGQFEFRLQNEGNTPRSILEEIIWNKDVEVSQMKENRPLGVVARALENAPPARDFIGALKASHTRTGLPSLIAEVKKASPSRGVLREDFDPASAVFGRLFPRYQESEAEEDAARRENTVLKSAWNKARTDLGDALFNNENLQRDLTRRMEELKICKEDLKKMKVSQQEMTSLNVELDTQNHALKLRNEELCIANQSLAIQVDNLQEEARVNKEKNLNIRLELQGKLEALQALGPPLTSGANTGRIPKVKRAE